MKHVIDEGPYKTTQHQSRSEGAREHLKGGLWRTEQNRTEKNFIRQEAPLSHDMADNSFLVTY